MDIIYAKYLLNKTKADYNLIASDFSRTRNKLWPELYYFKKYLNKKDKVLDIGCGNGRLLELFLGEEVDYTGVDFSENLIALAKEKHPDHKFLVADSLGLPFENNIFDKVFSIAVLHTIPSKAFRDKAVLEMKRVLKPGGTLIITVWRPRYKMRAGLLLKYTFLKLINKSKLDWKDVLIPWADKTKRYYHLFGKRELTSLFKKHNFEIIEKGILKDKKSKRANIYLVAESIAV